MEFEGSKSNKAILSAAKSLFWKHGIRRVTVDEICKEASVSKMTFYRSFKNKIEVAGEIFNHLAEKGMADYRVIMDGEEPFPEKVKTMLKLKDEQSKEISMEFIKDIYQHEIPELKERLEKFRAMQLQELMADFSKAQKEGWIRKEIKIEFILYSLNDLQLKISDPRFLAMYDNAHDAVMELTNYFFHGILSIDKK